MFYMQGWGALALPPWGASGGPAGPPRLLHGAQRVEPRGGGRGGQGPHCAVLATEADDEPLSCSRPSAAMVAL